MTALATIEDVQARAKLTPDDTARAAALLEDASAAVRRLAGQSFTRTETRREIWPTDNRFTLSGKDIANVTVTDEAGHPVPVSKVGPGMWATSARGPLTVVYTEGWEDVPADVVAVVASMVARAISTDTDKLNVTQQQEMAGSFSLLQSFGAAGNSGVGMLPAERDIVASYRRQPRGIQAGSWASR